MSCRPLRNANPLAFPPSPPFQVTPINGINTLPVELKLLIIQYAIEDDDEPSNGEWQDLATLRVFLALDKQWSILAGRLYWRVRPLPAFRRNTLLTQLSVQVIDLNLLHPDRFENFGRILRPLTRLHVQVILAPRRKNFETPWRALVSLVTACPRVSKLQVTVLPPLSHWDDYVEVPAAALSRLRDFSLCCFTPEKTNTMPLPPGLAVSALKNLDGKKLTRLCISGSAAAFDYSTPAFSHHLSRYTCLTHLHLEGVSLLPNFHISDLANDAPLRSIHLNLGPHKVSADSLMHYLARCEATLEHFTIVAVVEGEPVADLVLPKLRQLRLFAPNPHLLLRHLRTPPIALLDILPMKLQFLDNDYHTFLALHPSIRLLVLSQLPTVPPTSGPFDLLIATSISVGILVLKRILREDDRAASLKALQVGMEELDGWLWQWRVYKERAGFLQEERLKDLSLTAQLA